VSITYAHYRCDVPSELVQNIMKLKKYQTPNTQEEEKKNSN
jgi:hypothetical protein